MENEITIDEFKEAIAQLPPEIREELNLQSPTDTVAVKMELVKFVSELQKHNQGVDWETNKVKPKQIQVKNIISEASALFDFLMK